MRNDNSGWMLIVAIAVTFLGCCIFAVVMSSDMPTWAKWLLLTW